MGGEPLDNEMFVRALWEWTNPHGQHTAALYAVPDYVPRRGGVLFNGREYVYDGPLNLVDPPPLPEPRNWYREYCAPFRWIDFAARHGSGPASARLPRVVEYKIRG